MGLKDLFKRKKADVSDDEDDDFDAEDFEDGDAAVSVDGADGGTGGEPDGNDPGFGGSSLDGAPEGDGDKPAAAPDAGGGDLDAAKAEDDSDFGELDMDGDESDFDEDEDDEDESGGLFSKPIVRYSAIGAGVLLILIIAGVGAWMLLGDSDEVAEQGGEVNQSAIALPPLNAGGSGGLNDLAGGDDKPSEDEEAFEQETTVSASLNSVQTAGGLNALAGGSLGSSGTATSGVAGLIIQASTVAAFKEFVDHPTPAPLARAPDPDFLEIRDEEESFAALPKVAPDGRLPWEFYSNPLRTSQKTKRVAILVTDLGLSQAVTLAAIRKLPPAVTLSFSPYSDDLDQWLLRSRRAGHEVIFGLPLESSRFPIEDPGPLALSTAFTAEENLPRLESIMALLQGYIGLEVIMGSRYTASESHTQALLDELNSRGLMILEGNWNDRSLLPKLAGRMGMPRVFSNMRLDNVMALSAIDDKLALLDSLIETRNQAMATTSMSPGIMGRLKTWFQTLPEKEAKLVPVSALVTSKVITPEQ